MKQFRFTILPLILVMALFVSSCGSLFTNLRIALNSAGPLVTFLVSKNLLDQTKADAIIRDFGDAVAVAATLDTEIKAATTKPEKFIAAQKAERAWRDIYNRGHFGSNSAVKTAADIADGIFASILLFYGGTPATRDHVPGGPIPLTEKQLAEKIKAQTDALKKALEVR